MLCSISAKQAHENLHPTAPRSAAVQALEQCLVDMARRYRDPNVRPFDPFALVAAYNGLLVNRAHHYLTGQAECSMEFLSSPHHRGGGLLNNMEFMAGFLTTFDQHGFCPRCQVHQQLVIIKAAYLLSLIMIICSRIQSRSFTFLSSHLFNLSFLVVFWPKL